MCVAAIAINYLPDHPLIVVTNRDEFHGRNSASAHFWEDRPEILAGRDLEKGGTWLGVSKTGRFSMVTNYREPDMKPAPRSRGELVSEFLDGSESASDYLQDLDGRNSLYGGFNLLVYDGHTMLYASNRRAGIDKLNDGLYGVSNHLLDTPWPKVSAVKNDVSNVLLEKGPDREELFRVMQQKRIADDAKLPETGVGLTKERQLSPVFISGDRYGTRCTSIVEFRNDGTLKFTEQRYLPQGIPEQRSTFTFNTEKVST